MAETILHHTSYHKPPCGSSHFMIFEEWDFDFKEEWVLLWLNLWIYELGSVYMFMIMYAHELTV